MSERPSARSVRSSQPDRLAPAMSERPASGPFAHRSGGIGTGSVGWRGGRHRADHRVVGGRSVRGGRRAGGSRVVRRRQSAHLADRHDRRAGSETGERHRAARAGRRAPAHRGAHQGRRAAGRRIRRADGVPRRIDARAGAPLRRDPTSSSARRPVRRPRRGDRTRAFDARTGAGRRRPRDRHERSQRAPAQGAHRPRLRHVEPGPACRSPSRASGSSTVCRSTPTS